MSGSIIDRELRIFFLASLTFTLSRAFIDSLFPLYLQDLGAQAAEISFIVTGAGLIATVCMSVSPLLAQRYGAKTLLVVSSGLGVIPPLALSLSDQWLVAAPWTILHHVVFALHLPARMLFIADQSRQGAVGRVFGYMNLVWPLAGIIGPLVGGVVADTWGWPPVFYLQILLALLPLGRDDGREKEQDGDQRPERRKPVLAYRGLTAPPAAQQPLAARRALQAVDDRSRSRTHDSIIGGSQREHPAPIRGTASREIP